MTIGNRVIDARYATCKSPNLDTKGPIHDFFPSTRFPQGIHGRAGLLAAAPWLLRAAEPVVHFNGTDIVELGKTGIKFSRLAQGTGFNGYNHSSEHTRQGKAAFDRLLRHSLDQGISFIDMADLYGSHPFVQDVIKGLPRNKLTLLTRSGRRRPLGSIRRAGPRRRSIVSARNSVPTISTSASSTACRMPNGPHNSSGSATSFPI